MKKEMYDTPLFEEVSLLGPLQLLENLSVQAPIENFGDGGFLESEEGDGDFWNYD